MCQNVWAVGCESLQPPQSISLPAEDRGLFICRNGRNSDWELRVRGVGNPWVGKPLHALRLILLPSFPSLPGNTQSLEFRILQQRRGAVLSSEDRGTQTRLDLEGERRKLHRKFETWLGESPPRGRRKCSFSSPHARATKLCHRHESLPNIRFCWHEISLSRLELKELPFPIIGPLG